jgi:hypothetical protein
MVSTAVLRASRQGGLLSVGQDGLLRVERHSRHRHHRSSPSFADLLRRDGGLLRGRTRWEERSALDEGVRRTFLVDRRFRSVAGDTPESRRAACKGDRRIDRTMRFPSPPQRSVPPDPAREERVPGEEPRSGAVQAEAHGAGGVARRMNHLHRSRVRARSRRRPSRSRRAGSCRGEGQAEPARPAAPGFHPGRDPRHEGAFPDRPHGSDGQRRTDVVESGRWVWMRAAGCKPRAAGARADLVGFVAGVDRRGRPRCRGRR